MKASQGSGTICVLGQATGVGVVVVVAGWYSREPNQIAGVTALSKPPLSSYFGPTGLFNRSFLKSKVNLALGPRARVRKAQQVAI